MSDILRKNLISTLGLEGLSDEEKLVFLDNLGAVVLETALVRFMTELNEERLSSLNYYLDTKPTADALMERLLTQYPDFERVLEECMVEMKTDVLAVLGEKDRPNEDVKAEGGSDE